MPLTKPNQQLRRDLKDAAFALESAALEIFHKAQGGEEAQFLEAMKRVGELHELADRLVYAEEVKSGRVARTKE
ncbi:hypothetical protein LU640_25550 [Pseudomonas monteilii]|uniref:hypothetical protein n=1 Tax=Pseudomonas TaxID=286 RepID=UPI0007DDFB74|nr:MULTISPECIES: hypothetical protein [Pseudomonas]ANI33837.1 peptidase [Pseudomonas sp. JY-Q]MCE1020514.1 hypothetical protein [Pseudomonas monteilii]MCE1037918.1 hypothetical protein [Pseudomonas monteilii]MCE1089991.1 hypothetical protein [Pseudomonas monteilii]WQE51991.1 hypothetical protein U0028_19170 [Pseudomonas putida]